jgi:hypothetical protein
MADNAMLGPLVIAATETQIRAVKKRNHDESLTCSKVAQPRNLVYKNHLVKLVQIGGKLPCNLGRQVLDGKRRPAQNGKKALVAQRRHDLRRRLAFVLPALQCAQQAVRHKSAHSLLPLAVCRTQPRGVFGRALNPRGVRVQNELLALHVALQTSNRQLVVVLAQHRGRVRHVEHLGRIRSRRAQQDAFTARMKRRKRRDIVHNAVNGNPRMRRRGTMLFQLRLGNALQLAHH